MGPHVLLNMNRCIQCTRCVRFTQEISKTWEIGFFERGARVEIGTFPGKPLENPLSGCVVDICPVGALTSTKFRFAERVWYLDKKPSICTGCDVGCAITLEHRRGEIRRYKPRFNPEVNDYWMCDFGRTTFERYQALPRLSAPRLRRHEGALTVSWKEALDTVAHQLRAETGKGEIAFLGSGFLTNEEAFLLAQLATLVGSPHRAVWVDHGPARTIPNLKGGITGHDAAPNRRGAELGGLVPAAGGLDAEDLLVDDGAARCGLLVVADSDFGKAARDPRVVERLRKARFLVVLGWADTPLAQAADVALPTATHAEQEGTFVNAEGRVQRFQRAFPPPGEARPGVEVVRELLARFEPQWAAVSIARAFALLASAVPAFSGMVFDRLPATGAPLSGRRASAAGPSAEEVQV